MRILVTLVLLVAAALVALWQLDVIDLPLDRLSRSQQTEPVAGTLFATVKAGDLTALESALAAGVEIDARDSYGQTPLMYAASEAGDPAVVAALLAAGADVNATTKAGWTPLMYAARDADDPRTVLLLLNAGADPTVRNSDGETALDYARQNPAIRSTGLIRRLEALTDGPFTPGWPSGYVVPVEGATISSRPNHLPGAPRAYRNGTHEGFDFYNGTVSVPITYGTPIRAVAEGVVIRADHDYQEMTLEQYEEVIATAKRSLATPPEILDKLRGRQVWIEHPGGFISRYAHLSAIEPNITVGTRVEQGQVIAATGNSGTLEAAQGTEDDPHPHVEIWHGDTYLGQGLEPDAIYELAAQLFGDDALPPYTE